MQWWKMQPREKMSTACVRRDDEKLGPPAIAHDDALPPAPAPAPAPDTDKELEPAASQGGMAHGGWGGRGRVHSWARGRKNVGRVRGDDWDKIKVLGRTTPCAEASETPGYTHAFRVAGSEPQTPNSAQKLVPERLAQTPN